MFPRILSLAAVAALCLLAGCAERAPAPRYDDLTRVDTSYAPIEITDVEGVARRLFMDGRVYVAGQPSADAIRALADRGVTAVVNLRTPKEMADTTSVDFDEAALVAELGMEYVHLPLGGADHPYRPSVLSTFDRVLADHDGPILVHCRSGGRASYVWAGYLVRHRGWTLDEGLRRGMAIGISDHPLQGLLDTELTLTER